MFLSPQFVFPQISSRFFHLLLAAASGGWGWGGGGTPACAYGAVMGCEAGVVLGLQRFSGGANMWTSWGDFCFQLWIFIVVTLAERDIGPGQRASLALLCSLAPSSLQGSAPGGAQHLFPGR